MRIIRGKMTWGFLKIMESWPPGSYLLLRRQRNIWKCVWKSCITLNKHQVASTKCMSCVKFKVCCTVLRTKFTVLACTLKFMYSLHSGNSKNVFNKLKFSQHYVIASVTWASNTWLLLLSFTRTTGKLLLVSSQNKIRGSF